MSRGVLTVKYSHLTSPILARNLQPAALDKVQHHTIWQLLHFHIRNSGHLEFRMWKCKSCQIVWCWTLSRAAGCRLRARIGLVRCEYLTVSTPLLIFYGPR